MTFPGINDQNSQARLEPLWDVVIIGAGVAGGLLAGLCARNGLKTLLVEKESWPRNKVCGCCLNQRGFGVLRRNGVLPFLKDHDCVPLEKMNLVGTRTRATLSLPGGWVLSRTGLDQSLTDWAQSLGAKFQCETVARPHPNESNELASVALENRNTSMIVTTRFVVGAWGLTGNPLKWDKALNTQIHPDSLMGAGTQINGDIDSSLPPGTLLMSVGRGGYVGVVRLGDGSLDVAAAFNIDQVRKMGGPGQLAWEILRKRHPKLAQACLDASWKGTPGLTRTAGKISSRRFLLVGDAVGYVEPFTGEGMTWALVGAEALASALSETSKSEDSALALEKLSQSWEGLYRKRIKNRQGICRGISASLRHPLLTECGIGLVGLMPSIGMAMARWLARP